MLTRRDVDVQGFLEQTADKVSEGVNSVVKVDDLWKVKFALGRDSYNKFTCGGPLIGRDPTLWEKLDFDNDCNYDVEIFINEDTAIRVHCAIIWAIILFVLFGCCGGLLCCRR